MNDRLARSKWLYFIVAEESGRIKVGRSDVPEMRIRDFQTASPEPLSLLATIPESPGLDERRRQLLSDAGMADDPTMTTEEALLRMESRQEAAE